MGIWDICLYERINHCSCIQRKRKTCRNNTENALTWFVVQPISSLGYVTNIYLLSVSISFPSHFGHCRKSPGMVREIKVILSQTNVTDTIDWNGVPTLP